MASSSRPIMRAMPMRQLIHPHQVKKDQILVYLHQCTSLSHAALLQPFLKFSGTLGAQNRQDKRSATVMAFSHFVIEDTACQYMFADIQGSMDRSTTMHNESVLTLFDPMTHTPASQSGLGDHGLEGFEDFLKCHRCTTICSSMELCKLSVMAETIQGIKEELEADPDA